MKKLLNFLFGNKNRVNEFEMLFGYECAGKVEHGIIAGTWVKEGKPREIAITFHFVGAMHPPKLTMAVMEEMFFHAKMAGIVPSHIYSYAGLATARRSTDSRDSITPMNHATPRLQSVR